MSLFLLILASLIFQSSDALIYYIGADSVNQTCSMNDNKILLTPCYSLQQLSNDDSLLIKKPAITLLLLPGKQIIPENYTLVFSDVDNVQISPWTERKERAIECHSEVGFVFENFKNLNIFSLNFTSCTLFLRSVNSDFKANAVFTNCAFTHTAGYVISVVKNRRTHNVEFNISVNLCVFSKNNGTLSCNFGPGLLPDINVFLYINKTLFLSNQGNFTSGSLFASNTNLEIRGSLFANNSAIKGGGLSGFFSTVLIYDTEFINNHANASVISPTSAAGGAIHLFNSSSAIYNCLFLNNSADDYGGAIHSWPTQEFYAYNSQFLNNFVMKSGGALYAEGANLSNCHFENNYAGYFGGAIRFRDGVYGNHYIQKADIIGSTFYYNQAGDAGGAIDCEKRGFNILLHQIYSLMNSAELKGGFLSAFRCSITVYGNSEIKRNWASLGGALSIAKSELIIMSNTFPGLSFVNNTAEISGGAIFAVDSIMILNGGKVSFDYNRVTSGNGKGGAIYIEDSDCKSTLNYIYGDCPIESLSSKQGVKDIYFTDNSAAYGPVLYGGLLDRCYQVIAYDPYIVAGIDYFKQISKYEETARAITSDPVMICFCKDNIQLPCTVRVVEAVKMRGETLKITVISLDQNNNSVPSVLRAGYEEITTTLGKGEERNGLSNCTALSYHVFSVNSSAKLTLHPEGFCELSLFSSLTINVKIVGCARGFEQKEDRCVCERRLKHLNVTNCNIDDQTIENREPIWLQYDEKKLMMVKYCPFNYCQATPNNISLLFPDEQCANHRSGILCGACQHNYSITLGGSKCLSCTSTYSLIWLILVFAVAGVALVALLLVCNMTISHGTLNGLIFYANVVSISGLTSLKNCYIHPVLSVFIAWVNLDLGVEICFYPGMDTYQKTWLQFAFPLYIILLVIAVLVISYYSSKAMKVFGRNNISVLATLFLVSYTKILKTIITALSATQLLESSAGDVTASVLPYEVWTYDGNLQYLKGKHIVLFTVSLVLLLFLFLPYTLLLIFGQCMRSVPVRRRWLSRATRSTAFISIIDAYHAPYNRQHRYWTGFLLLTRCILFLAFTTSYNYNKILTNSYITVLIISGILLAKTCSTKVYKNIWMNVLELSFLYNLEVLAVSLYFLKSTNIGGDSIMCKSIISSISISFITFIGIVVYHLHLQMQKINWYMSIKQVIMKKLPFHLYESNNSELLEAESEDQSSHLPTTYHVELREELLDSDY